jgi:lysozyme
MRKLNKAGEALIKQWEELILYPYDDADTPARRKPIQPGMKVRGTLTAGWGHTGADVKPGMTVTKEMAQAWFNADVAIAGGAVERLVKVPLTDNQYGALVAFVLNVGVAAFKGSTLLRRLNAGGYSAVPTELMKWTKTTIAGKKVDSNGLRNRRAAEAGLWVKGSFVASSSVMAQPVKAPLISKEVGTTATALVSGGALQFLPTEGPMAYALAAILVAAVLFLGFLYIQSRRHE